MDPQWPSRKAERLSGSGRGRLNSYSPSRQTRVSPCAPVLCPLGASSRVRRRSHTRRHGVRPQKAHPPTLLLQPSIVCVLLDPDSPKTGIDAAAPEFSLSSSAAAGRGFLVFCASPFDVLLRSRTRRRSHTFSSPPPDICWVLEGGSPSISSSTGTHTIFASELLRRSSNKNPQLLRLQFSVQSLFEVEISTKGLRTLPGDCNRCEPPPFSPAPRAPELSSSVSIFCAITVCSESQPSPLSAPSPFSDYK